jgi:hypothetical protein
MKTMRRNALMRSLADRTSSSRLRGHSFFAKEPFGPRRRSSINYSRRFSLRIAV